MVKVIVVVVALVAMLGVYAYFTQEGPSPYDLPAAVAIDPPAGAVVLPDEVKAGDVLRPVMSARGDEAVEAARAEFVGMWTPLRGWTGGVKRVEVREASTWFSVEMFDSGILGQQFFIEVEVPGGVPQIKPGVSVTFRGCVKDVVPSPDPALIPGRIKIDQATVLAPSP